METEILFIKLLHRFKKYADAMVLHCLLQQHADVEEFKTSAQKIAQDLLAGQLTKLQVQRSLNQLAETGFVTTRIHSNFRTHISVDRDAVLKLLHEQVSSDLPGLRQETFPFLSACADAQAEATN